MKQTIEIEVPDGYKAVYDKDTQKVEMVKVKIAKVKLPKSWEEFCENFPFKKGECVISYYGTIDYIYAEERYKKSGNILPNEETAEAFLALMQLIQLRDCYRQEWKPDWCTGEYKFTITYGRRGLTYGYCWKNRILSFQSEDICYEFLTNFRDLIEKAKELI